jgi:hypothetical protein
MDLSGEAVAGGVAARAGVDQPIAVDETPVHRPLRHLVGRQPVAVRAHGGKGPAGEGVAARVGDCAVESLVVIAAVPRTVVVVVLESRREVAFRYPEGVSDQRALKGEAAHRQVDDPVGQGAHEIEIDAPGR